VSRLPRHYDADLALAGAFALAALVVTIVPFPDAVRAALFLPLALFLPGYLLAAVIFVPGAITRVERVAFVCAFTVSFWAIGGLVVQLAFGLDRGIWLGLLIALTVAAIPVAQARRAGRPRPRPWRPRLDLRRLAPIPVAVGVVAIAIAIASSSADSQLAHSRFSSVWIVRSKTPAVSGVAVGVENHEGDSVQYRLRVSQGGHIVSQSAFPLDDGETWEREIGISPAASGERVVAALFRDGTLYRRAAFDPGVAE
jgi:uncharacterized membrane protein